VNASVTDIAPIAKLRHDLANPLAALLAETQLMLLGDAPLPDEVRTGLQEIEKLAIRMRSILRETKTG
jgi:signal transduction histidine kinase